MDLESYWPAGQIDRVVFECVVELGIEAVTLDEIAERTRCSRAGLYRRYKSRQQLLAYAHHRAMSAMNHFWPERQEDRRLEFELWWSLVSDFFRTRFGRALLEMRPHMVGEGGIDAVEHRELETLTRFTAWLGGTKVGPRAIWGLALVAGCTQLRGWERESLREMAWRIASPGRDDDDDLNIESLEALEAPL